MANRNHDPDQAAVYAAEADVRLFLDELIRGSGGQTGVVNFLGGAYEPEVEPRFSSPAEVGVHVERICRHLTETGADFGGRERQTPRVRARRGDRAAHYEPGTQTIAIPDDIAPGGWAMRGSVVWHELAHHLAGDTQDGDHGASFRATLLRLLEAIDVPEIAGMLLRAYESRGLSVVGFSVDEHTLETMRRLLAQAEATDSEAERDICMDRVQRLATRHQVALAVLRARTTDQEFSSGPVEETVQIGEPGQRSLWCYVNLMTGIMHANNLKGTVAYGNTSMTMLGFREDIDVAKQLFYSLSRQMQAAWERHLLQNPVEYSYVGRSMQRKKIATITRKNAFFGEFGNQMTRRLIKVRDEAMEQEILDAAAQNAQDDDPGWDDDDEWEDSYDGMPWASVLGVPMTGVQADPADPESEGGTLHLGLRSHARPQRQDSGELGSVTGVQLALRDREVAVTDAFKEMIEARRIRRSWRQPADAVYKAPGTALAGQDAAEQASLGGERELGA
jgi:putative metallohydrolase (TIGR04338 family)